MRTTCKLPSILSTSLRPHYTLGRFRLPLLVVARRYCFKRNSRRRLMSSLRSRHLQTGTWLRGGGLLSVSFGTPPSPPPCVNPRSNPNAPIVLSVSSL
jgi:hypothetical protein